MSSITLADVRAAVEAKYGPFVVALSDGAELVLRNPLRLGDAEREAFTAKPEEDVPEKDALINRLKIAAEKPWLVDKLVEDLDGELVMLLEVFTQYAKSTQVGEASASQD